MEHLTLPPFKDLLKLIIIKTVWYWQNDRYINQGHRTENPKKQKYAYYMVNWFSVRYREFQCGGWEGSLFINGALRAKYLYASKEYLLYHTIYTKISSEWSTDLTAKTIIFCRNAKSKSVCLCGKQKLSNSTEP